VNVASRNHFPEHAKTLRYLVLNMWLGLQCPEFEWLGHNHTKGITRTDITSLQKLQNVRPCACAGKEQALGRSLRLRNLRKRPSLSVYMYTCRLEGLVVLCVCFVRLSFCSVRLAPLRCV